MEKFSSKELISFIKSTTENKVLHGLREIKRRVVPNINALGSFRQYGLIPIIIKLIQHSNEEIVNLSLSILSVCTSHFADREEIFRLGGCDLLIRIYTNADSELLRLRACRNIANQSQHKESCSRFHNKNIPQSILENLKKDSNDDSISSAIRAIRILSDTGDHCQAVVMAEGVSIVCEKGLSEEPPLGKLKATLKAIAQFSRIAHSSCINQLMTSTDNLQLVTRYHDHPDLEVYELILRTNINIVRSCFNPAHRRPKSLDAKIIDHLCTARVPSIIVKELQNRKTFGKGLDEEVLVSSLCKFCEGSSQCNNLAQNNLNQAPTFLGRAWMQLMECGGVTLLVNLLDKYKDNMKLLSYIYGALLGIEHNYSFKEKVLKHCLAANILPYLVQQFDKVVNEYKSIRREGDPDQCIHVLKTELKKDLSDSPCSTVTQTAMHNIASSSFTPETSSSHSIPAVSNLPSTSTFHPPLHKISPPSTPIVPLQGEPPSLHAYQHISPAPSPPPSLSPIRCPSDWDEEEEGDDRCESSLSGRFSPTVPDVSDLADPSMETEEMDTSVSEETEVNQSILDDIGEKLMISSNETPKKRSHGLNKQGSCDDLDIKRIRIDEPSPNVDIAPEEKDATLKETVITTDPKIDLEDSLQVSESRSTDEVLSESDCSTTPGIKEMSQIKFRVGKKKGIRRKLTLVKPQPRQSIEDLWEASETAKSLQTPSSPPITPKSQKVAATFKKSKHISSQTKESDPNAEESRCLLSLEWIIRMMSQVSLVKEAITPVCREFVPRVITYISCAQKLHFSALNILVFIAKNALSIQPLLDAQFIPYVAVELVQSRTAAVIGQCAYCHMLHEGGKSFLTEMTKFFNHVHQYGTQEVCGRLHPDRTRAIKESCACAIPHIMTCPKILHNFLVRYPGLDILIEILTSDESPDSASFIYAAAALSQLATTLQVDFQLKKYACPLCAQSIKNTVHDLSRSKSASNVEAQTDCNGHPVICHWEKDTNKNLTFKLEDGSEVCANRELLASRNDILRGMLKGSFAESVKEEVQLTGISRKCLEFLIHFLYGCTCRVYYSGNLELYLELVFVAQMYFLSSLGNFAAFKVVSSIEKPEDVLRIYESGVGRIHEDAILHALCTVLIKPMKTWKRARWFKFLFTSKYSEDIIHNITLILKHPLIVNNDVCTCDMSQSLYKASEQVYEKL